MYIDKIKELCETTEKVLEKSFWITQQTSFSMISIVIEEAYELIDAIKEAKIEELIEELGDLLGLVLMLCLVVQRDKKIDLYHVIDEHIKKCKNRQPYIFEPEKTPAFSAKEAENQWHALKKQEIGKRDRKTSVDGLPSSSPALTLAYQACARMSQEGYELKEKYSFNDLNEKKIGDLLWSISVCAQRKNLQPEYILRKSIQEEIKKNILC
ncbi:Nucleoside triphosphate pyrophosphohydrolase [Candidatus Clavichlamydia salmonicola]|uniref:MazG nucleotide pyrophosphohydrolase domain-containing protein n=1 Tax=Candidatus Clavichlamydia salmonicola TaxID=469812 RepID=UPI001890E106|nr:MazG nucleotide pyrophosphohydrolase domain-containing protein [Candidatus Clavichlamydia salmonicola]MBF5051135.1 Nucleoside triphosphate pyrophosphohydrolase [Candidatus Clavichlamydia salmonicola]